MIEDEIRLMYGKISAAHPGGISLADALFIVGIIQEHKPGAILEIGCAAGVSTSVIQKACLVNEALRNTAIVSFDISPYWYADKEKPVGFLMDELLETKHPHFELITTRRNWDAALARFRNAEGRKLVFIDANHKHPYPTIDTLKVMDALTDGDIIVYHDVGVWEDSKFARGNGARVLWQQYPEKNKIYSKASPNIGAVYYDRARMLEAAKKSLAVKPECEVDARELAIIQPTLDGLEMS